MVVFIASEAALCRVRVAQRGGGGAAGDGDMVYGIAALAVLADRRGAHLVGVKGTAWYWTNPLLHIKLTLFIIIGVMSISPTYAPSCAGARSCAPPARCRPRRDQQDAQAGDDPGAPDRR